MAKKFLSFFSLAAYAVGSLGSLGYLCYAHQWVIAVCSVAVSAMAFPKAKEAFKYLTEG